MALRDSAAADTVGSSGNAPGEKEHVSLSDAPAGTYVLRVVNYSSVAPSYTLTSGAYDSVARHTQGVKERYVLTCERDGKIELRTTVYVARGQVRNLDLSRCRG